MSRNLAQRTCDFCDGEVKETGPRHPITREEAFVYFPEVEGMIVADAECVECEAKYLAWIDGTGRSMYRGYPRPDDEYPIQDLSFRSTFNDEPGESDMPKWKIEREVIVHRKPWSEP